MDKKFPGATYCASDQEELTNSEEDFTTTNERGSDILTDFEINRGLSAFVNDPTEQLRTRASSPKTTRTTLQQVIRRLTQAILDFILSELAMPYIEQIQKHENESFSIKSFCEYIRNQREYLGYSRNLKGLVLCAEGENEQEVAYKRVFRKIAVIFLKFFVVNWLFQSRLRNKEVYLKLRFKLLRIIQYLM